MTTVILRAATPPLEDTTATSAPTLARLTEVLTHRRLGDQPLYIDPITYEAAESEMKELLLKRGYSEIVPANLPQRNFRLFGVPIVREDD